MNISMKAAAAIAAVLLVVTGCASGEITGDESRGDNAPTAEEEVSESTDEEGSDVDGVAAFGQTYDFDGLELKVGKPKPFEPSEYAAGVDGYDDFVRFKVRVVNGSDEKYDPTMFYATLQSGNEEAESVFDSDSNLEGEPSTTVLPGREVEWSIGFGVVNPDDLVMEVTPDMFNAEAVIYATS